MANSYESCLDQLCAVSGNGGKVTRTGDRIEGNDPFWLGRLAAKEARNCVQGPLERDNWVRRGSGPMRHVWPGRGHVVAQHLVLQKPSSCGGAVPERCVQRQERREGSGQASLHARHHTLTRQTRSPPERPGIQASPKTVGRGGLEERAWPAAGFQ